MLGKGFGEIGPQGREDCEALGIGAAEEMRVIFLGAATIGWAGSEWGHSIFTLALHKGEQMVYPFNEK